ncbi:hypothetical protein BS47DRAFT_1348240 [Hydnum rufescens UP504]|uniref:4-coumarate-CoA ligase n=1 Tax=Hydnum rufescens UP504 TaxID=1448309 RepID=A0A9P6AQL0_9AGAM|nr:hypothetical protein BS47DRAFT_1348240 [Hydnum rufescens UP504]
MPTIYSSPYPPTSIPRISVFNFFFPNNDPHANLPAFIDGISGRVLTRAQLQRDARVLAFGLRNSLEKLHGALNVSRNGTILVFSPNSMSYPLIICAALVGGIRLSLASSALMPPELAYQIKDSEPSHIAVHPTLFPVLLKALEILGVESKDFRRRIILLAPPDEVPPELNSQGWLSLGDAMKANRQLQPERFDRDEADQTTLILYSSGTTGLPKGVELTHYNIVAQVLSMQNSKRYPDQAGVDVTIGTVPYFHVYGVLSLIHHPLASGIASVVLPKFEPATFLSAIQKYHATSAYCAPPSIAFIANSPLIILSAAAVLSTAIAQKAVLRLGAAGAKDVHICEVYGLTETTGGATTTPYGYKDKPTSCGRLVANAEARLVRDDGTDSNEGERGELWIRGPCVMKGYLNKPHATREAMEDGFYKTGDILVRDNEGFFYIVDRKKELIKYQGYQVSPAEIENVLFQHPDVEDCAVIGVSDPETQNELPRAYIVPRDRTLVGKPASTLTPDIQQWVKDRLSPYKALRGGVRLIAAVPKSPAGKVLRRELQTLARNEKMNAVARL